MLNDNHIYIICILEYYHHRENDLVSLSGNNHSRLLTIHDKFQLSLNMYIHVATPVGNERKGKAEFILNTQVH